MPSNNRTDPDDGLSPLARGWLWVHRITAISFEMVIPAAIGYWLDGKFETSPWLLVAGAIFGFAIAMGHLLQLAKSLSPTDDPPPRPR